MELSYNKFEVLSSKKWEKTHVKTKVIFGASFCRFVDEKDAEKKTPLTHGNLPTCMDCLFLVSSFILGDKPLNEDNIILQNALVKLHRIAKYK